MASGKPAGKPTGKPSAKPAKGSRLNFKLELSCACKPPICSHAGPGIAKLLSAAYAKGRRDGMSEAVQGVGRAAAKVGLQVGVEPTRVAVRQKGSSKSQ